MGHLPKTQTQLYSDLNTTAESLTEPTSKGYTFLNGLLSLRKAEIP